jgi:hypothetical protein
MFNAGMGCIEVISTKSESGVYLEELIYAFRLTPAKPDTPKSNAD